MEEYIVDPTPENIKRYARIIEKIRDKKFPSSDEMAFFMAMKSAKWDDDQIKQLAKEAKSDDINVATNALQQWSELLIRFPEQKEKYIEEAKELGKAKATEKVANAIDVALSIGDIATSAAQIKESKNLQRKLSRPTQPVALTADPLLKQAIAEAQQGTFDTYRQLAPAQQAILDQYLSDLNQAKTASTGQAGAYGALGQVASIRRGRGIQQLAPMADSIRAREQARLDNLIGMKLNENQAIQQSQSQFYPQDLYQHRFDQQQAGSLGATGRLNMRNSLANLGEHSAGAFGDWWNRRQFDKLKSQTALGDIALKDGTKVSDIKSTSDDNRLARQAQLLYEQYAADMFPQNTY